MKEISETYMGPFDGKTSTMEKNRKQKKRHTAYVLQSPKYASGYLGSEAVVYGCFLKKVLLKISQNS